MDIQKILSVFDDILENVGEKINESSSQKDIQKEIFSLSKQIYIHGIKIVLYGIEEELTIHHWAHELNEFLGQCMDEKIKKIGKDRYPNEQELYKWITKRYPDSDSIDGIRRRLENEYIYQGHNKRNNISNDQLYTNLDAMIKEACPILANKQNTDDKIEEIVKKYRLG